MMYSDHHRVFPARFRGLAPAVAAALVAGGCVTDPGSGATGGMPVGPGPLPAAPACTVHVAVTGSDTNAGTREAPFATLVKARDAIRARRIAGTLGAGPVVVQLHDGIYRVTETLVLGKEDSGTEGAPVIWTAAPGATVRLVGGVRISDWRPVTSPAIRHRLAETARSNVVEADLSALGVTDFGTVKPGNARAEVFFNGTYLTLARYPNGGFVRIADVPEAAKKARPVKDPKRPDLHRYEGPFNYAGDRPERWKQAKHVWVHGYWFHDWADEHHEVLKFDYAKKELWVKPPYHAYGYKENQRYYYLNVLEELDEPGEWFLDRDSGKLYLWPPSPIAAAEVLFPVLQSPVLVLDQAEYVSVRGIVFECGRAGAISIKAGSHCDISGCTVRNVGGTGIDVRGGVHHTVRGCDVYEVAATAIGLDGGDRKTLARGDHVVENCHLHHFARIQKTYRPGVMLKGVGNCISHCYIHDCPHEGIGYAGNDHVIEYTEFTRIARETGDVGAIYAAMDWSYMGHVFRYNYFHHIHGPGKLGCFTVYPDLPCGGIHLHGNIFYDVDQIFHTNSGRGMRIENNIFYKAQYGINFSAWGDAKKFQLGGNWRMVERLQEIKYDQPPYSTRYPVLARLAEDFAMGKAHVHERAIPKDNSVRRNISDGGSFFLRIRGGRAALQQVRVESNYIADPVPYEGRLTAEGKSLTYRNDDDRIRTLLAKTGNVISSDAPGFVDPENGDFRLKPGAPAGAIGFEPIPFDKIGLCFDAFRRRLPPPLPKSPAKPILTPVGGFFAAPVDVAFTLPSGSGPAELHYTLDGGEPTGESPVVNGPLHLPETTTVRCAAFPLSGPASDRSEIVAATYRICGTLETGVFLSDLPVAADYIGYEPMGLLRDKAHGNRPLSLGGKVYRKGLITHPAQLPDGNRAVAEFALTGPLRGARRFTAVIGIEDQAPKGEPGHGTCTFAVELRHDTTWQRVFESAVMKAGAAPEQVGIDVSGAERIRIIATDAGDGIAWDHAVWAAAKLH